MRSPPHRVETFNLFLKIKVVATLSPSCIGKQTVNKVSWVMNQNHCFPRSSSCFLTRVGGLYQSSAQIPLDSFSWFFLCTPWVPCLLRLMICICSSIWMAVFRYWYHFATCSTLLLNSCCRNRIPETGWLKQQKFICSHFWRLEVQNQGLAWLFPGENFLPGS